MSKKNFALATVCKSPNDNTVEEIDYFVKSLKHIVAIFMIIP